MHSSPPLLASGPAVESRWTFSSMREARQPSGATQTFRLVTAAVKVLHQPAQVTVDHASYIQNISAPILPTVFDAWGQRPVRS